MHTIPAWNDADGGITFCAETEVGIRGAELEKEELLLKRCQIKKYKKLFKDYKPWNISKSIPNRCAYPLLWPLLFAFIPLEMGLELPEPDELEAEAEVEQEPWVLITAACLRPKKYKWNKSNILPVMVQIKEKHYLKM